MGMSFLFTVGIIPEKGRAAAFEKGRGTSLRLSKIMHISATFLFSIQSKHRKT